MKPVLYQYQISPFCDKVRRAMRLKGIEWEMVEIPVIPSAKFKHISPTGKFPAVEFGDRIIVDSSDIIRHLDEIAPEPRLLPLDPRHRADALILEDWADEILYFYDLTMRNWPQNRQWFLDDLLHAETGLKRRLLERFVPGALKKVATTQGLGRKSEAQVTADLALLYDSLAARLEGQDWLAGPTISIADLGVRSMVFVLDRTVEAKVLHRARPILAAWSARVDAVSL